MLGPWTMFQFEQGFRGMLGNSGKDTHTEPLESSSAKAACLFMHFTQALSFAELTFSKKS